VGEEVHWTRLVAFGAHNRPASGNRSANEQNDPGRAFFGRKIMNKIVFLLVLFAVVAIARAEFSAADGENLGEIGAYVSQMQGPRDGLPEGGQVFAEWRQTRKMLEVMAQDNQRAVGLQAAIVGLLIAVLVGQQMDFWKK